MLLNGQTFLSPQTQGDNASMSTRVIGAMPITTAAAPAPPPKEGVRARASQAVATSALSRNTITPQPEPPKNESNQPKDQTASAQSAIDSVAIKSFSDELRLTPTVAVQAPQVFSDQLAISAPAQAQANAASTGGVNLRFPPSVTLQFEGLSMNKGSAQSGSGALRWSVDGANYALSLEASALVVFTRTERSVGQLHAQGLAPQRYSSTRTGRSEQATHFQSELGRIQFSNNKPSQALLPGAQDRLSAVIQLAGLISGEPERYRSVERISMPVAGLDQAEIWEFKLEGLSELVLPAGSLQALKISRSPRNEYDQRLELWLAPQLGYLPVRIRQSANTAPDQNFTDLVLSRLP
jgi:hypothetical protein